MIPSQYVAPRFATVVILSEHDHGMSRETLTFKQSATVYDIGELLISEYNAGAKTGIYVRATQALVDAAKVLEIDDPDLAATFAVSVDYVDATAGNTPGPTVNHLAQVKGRELRLDASITVAEAKALLAKQLVIVR